MSNITTIHYLVVAALLFVLGVTGALIRRNILTALMSIELILSGVGLNLVAFSHMWGNLHGQVFALFIVAVAGAQAVVGLSIVVAFFRNSKTVDLDRSNLLKW
jgi:NADH-quinone oxidoreductase subunit K